MINILPFLPPGLDWRLQCVILVLSRFQNMTFYSIFEQDGVGDVNSNAQATKYVEKVSKICKFWIT